MNFVEDFVETLDSYKTLKELGWKGTISKVQREFYYESYRRNYPDSTTAKNQQRLALYMAESLARYQLNMSGKQEYWPSFIQITFVQPIKGLPEGYHNNCVYYRTIPLSQGRTHICPWRAKGYLKITGKTVSSKITTHHDDVDLMCCDIDIFNEELSVKVKVNYAIED
jgi:hypothetical protein